MVQACTCASKEDNNVERYALLEAEAKEKRSSRIVEPLNGGHTANLSLGLDLLLLKTA